jgi:hypothetical protein
MSNTAQLRQTCPQIEARLPGLFLRFRWN